MFGAREQFGIFVSADNLRRDVLVRDIIQTVGWIGPDQLFDRFETDRFPTKRDRTNISTHLQWRPTDNSEIYFRGRWGENDRNITSRATQNFDVRGEPVEIDDSSLVAPIRLRTENEERRQRNTSYHLQIGGELRPTDRWVLETSLAYSKSEARRPLWSKIRAQTLDFEGVLETDPRPNIRPSDPAFINDPANFIFNRVRLDGNDNDEDVWVPQLDITWQPDAFVGVTIKTGLKASVREKDVDGSSDRFVPIETITLDQIPGSTFPGPGNPGFPFGGSFLFDNVAAPLTLDWPALFDFFNNNRDLFRFQESESLANSVEDDYFSEEDIYAGYVMFQGETGPLFWTAGLRVEHTDFDTGAFRFTEFDDGSTGIDPVFGSNSYTDYLFNLQGRYSIAPDLAVRAAFTQSIGRPDFASAAPIQSFEVVQVGTDPAGQPVFIGSLDTGNAELDRFESDNFDLSFEYYSSETGLFAAAFFWKEIDNPIFNRRERINNTEFAGFALQSLDIDTFENASSGRVRGIELTAQEQLRFLPGLLSNFGVSLNYTLVDSESDVIDRPEKLPFFGQPDNIINAALFYQQAGFDARLAWRYRDDVLESIGSRPDQDIFRQSFQQLDFKVGYRFANGFHVFADIWNLTDQKPKSFQGDDSRLAGLERTGRFFNFGLQWSNL